MSRADKIRTASCSKNDAVSRLKQADAFLDVAELCLDDQSSLASPGVAAALAVLATIAASDAACCSQLGKRPRGQNHSQATALVKTLAPHGNTMAKTLADILSAKDDSHYGLTLVNETKARQLALKARKIVDWAHEIVSA